jgi:hypothetical protein
MAKLLLTGGCHCEALRYEVRAAPVMVYNCHCKNCQKVSGSAFNVSATIVESSFVFVKGAPKRIEWASDAGTMRFGWLCGECGSRIAQGSTPSRGVLSLRAGTLDDTSWVEPVGDIWTRSAQSWALFPSDRIRTEEQPKDYGPFLAAFQAQGRFQS